MVLTSRAEQNSLVFLTGNLFQRLTCNHQSKSISATTEETPGYFLPLFHSNRLSKLANYGLVFYCNWAAYLLQLNITYIRSARRAIVHNKCVIWVAAITNLLNSIIVCECVYTDSPYSLANESSQKADRLSSVSVPVLGFTYQTRVNKVSGFDCLMRTYPGHNAVRRFCNSLAWETSWLMCI